jgi:hypothetical protein
MFASRVSKMQTGKTEAVSSKSMPARTSHASRASGPGPTKHGAEDRGAASHRSWDFSKIQVFSSDTPKGCRSSSSPLAGIAQNLSVGGVNDASEQQASGIANQALSSQTVHPLLGDGMSRAKIHTGRHAAAAAASLDAAAFTVGDNIYFGAGRYRPDTPAGKQLIAHEAVHVGQQARSGHLMVQRAPNDTVQMPPLEITSTLGPTESRVPHLDRLSTPANTTAPAQMTEAHDDASIQKNAPDPATRLPFNSGGWDASELLNKLGQYDRLPGTDSDASRCVQAVGMAAHVTDGPKAVTAYLGSLIAQGQLTGQMTDRKKTAIQVLKHVSGRIDAQQATYGDMGWAQEAMHDLFYKDQEGTPEGDIKGQVNPTFDLTKQLQSTDVWCDNPKQLLDQAATLKPGEQFLVEEWSVAFNEAFEQLSDQKINVPTGGTTTVNINGKLTTISRIATDKRPPHTAIDASRDSKRGHQLLVVRDAASGALKLYEPEITNSGQHFSGLAADGSNLTTYFQDLPEIGIYHYIQIIGKLQPGIGASSGSPWGS